MNDFKIQNIKVLDNQSVLEEQINIIGISDNQTKDNKINIFEQLYDSDYFNLLLVHQPSIWNSLKEKANLTLSGHTHNGQIFPFNLIVKIQFPQIYGVYNHLKKLFICQLWSGHLGSKN